MRTLSGAAGRLDHLAVSPDGRELLAVGTNAGSRAVVWDLDGDPAGPRRLLPDYAVTGTGYAPDGRRLLNLLVSDERGGRRELVAVPAGAAGGEPVETDAEAFVAAGDRLLTHRLHHTGDRWACRLTCRRFGPAGSAATVWEVDEPPGVSLVARTALLGDGRAAVLHWWTNSRGRPSGRTLNVRAAADGRVLAATPVGDHTALSLLAAPDGRRLVVNGGTSLYVWHADDLAAPPRKVVFGRRPCSGLAFHPDGTLLAAGNDGTVRRIDPATGATAAAPRVTGGRAGGVTVAADGLTAAVGTDAGTVVLFDLD